MPLTDRAIRNLTATGKDKFVSDGGGLYLRVRPNGNKSFLFRSQRGTSRWVTLGEYPTLSLADARRRVADMVGTQSPEKILVEDVWSAWYAHLKRTIKRPDIPRQQVEYNLLPTLGKRQIRAVTRAEVTKVLNTIVERGSLISANRTLTYAKQLWKYAVHRGWLDYSVLADVSARAVGGREKPRERALTLDEIGVVANWLLTPSRLSSAVRGKLLMVLLTGQRIDEVAGMCDAEIVGDWWHIPEARAKTRGQKVYLSRPARRLWRYARALSPAPFAGPTPTADRAVARFIERVGMPHFTQHDLRHTMVTRLSDHGVMPHVTEKMLNHRMEGMMAVYNHAEFLPERKAAWRQWGRIVLQCYKKGRPENRP